MTIQRAIDIPAFLALSPRERVLKMLATVGLDEEFYDLEAKGVQLEKDRFAASTAKSEAKVRLRNIPDRVLPEDLIGESHILATMEENVRRCREKNRIMQQEGDRALHELETAKARRDEYMPKVMAKKKNELYEQRAKADQEVLFASNDEARLKLELIETAERIATLASAHPMPLGNLEIVDGDLREGGLSWADMVYWEQVILATRILQDTTRSIFVDKGPDPGHLESIRNWAAQNGVTVILKES